MFIDWFKNVSAMFVYVYKIYATTTFTRIKSLKLSAEPTRLSAPQQEDPTKTMMRPRISQPKISQESILNTKSSVVAHDTARKQKKSK